MAAPAAAAGIAGIAEAGGGAAARGGGAAGVAAGVVAGAGVMRVSRGRGAGLSQGRLGVRGFRGRRVRPPTQRA